MMESVRASETLVNIHQSSLCYNPEDSYLTKTVNFLITHNYINL